MPRKRPVNSPDSAHRAPTPDHVVAAILGVIERDGWDAVTLDRVARACGVKSLKNLHTPDDLFSFVVSWVDDRMAAVTSSSEESPVTQEGISDDSAGVKDRLFDLFMARFDALQVHRAGFVRLIHDMSRSVFAKGEVCAARGRLIPLFAAMDRVLTQAGIPGEGLARKFKIFSIFVLYLVILKVWIKDTSPDLSTTMAALDRRLDQWIGISGWVSEGGGP